MLYIGSCRYMYGFKWDFFPGRLHTTKEIIFFLENIFNIETIIKNNHSNLTDLIFGDIYHPSVIQLSKNFINKINNEYIKNIKKLVLEISSRKIMYYNDIPLNYYYTIRDLRNTNLIKELNIIEKNLLDEEIYNDINYIISLSKKLFNENIEIHIIPHLDLKTKNLNNYIPERHNFVLLLENICNKTNIKFHNIAKFIEKTYENNCFIEDYMPDSRHYDKNSKIIINNFLVTNIYL